MWLFVSFRDFLGLFSDVYCRLLFLPTWSQIQIETCVNDAYYNDWSLNNRPSRISLEDTDGMASNQGNYTLPIVTWTWNFQFCNWEIQVGNWKFIWMTVIKWNLISEWLLAHVNWKLQLKNNLISEWLLAHVNWELKWNNLIKCKTKHMLDLKFDLD